MMNAADAISAADNTVRPGLNAALRTPSRRTASVPRPAIALDGRERSHDERRTQRADQRRRPGAEERTGLRLLARESGRDRDDAEASENDGEESIAPADAFVGHRLLADRLGGEKRTRRDLSDRTERHEHAENGSDDAADRPFDQGGRRHVEAQLGSSHRTDPPGAKAVDDQSSVPDGAENAERAADNREGDRLAEEQRPYLRDREAGRAQHADLPQSLFDAKTEEEHREQQRRNDDEEAEVGEVLTEVGSAG